MTKPNMNMNMNIRICPPDTVTCSMVGKITPRWESLTSINDSLCTCLRSDWFVTKHTDSRPMPIGCQDYSAHRMLFEMDFPCLDKLTKGQIAFFSFFFFPDTFPFPNPLHSPLCSLVGGRGGWPNGLYYIPCPLISKWAWLMENFA